MRSVCDSRSAGASTAGAGIAEQCADSGEPSGAMSVGQEAEVADPAEAVGQDMQQEATDEFVGVERHHLGLSGCR